MYLGRKRDIEVTFPHSLVLTSQYTHRSEPCTIPDCASVVQGGVTAVQAMRMEVAVACIANNTHTAQYPPIISVKQRACPCPCYPKTRVFLGVPRRTIQLFLPLPHQISDPHADGPPAQCASSMGPSMATAWPLRRRQLPARRASTGRKIPSKGDQGGYFNGSSYGELGSNAAKKVLLQTAKALKNKPPADKYKTEWPTGCARSGERGVANRASNSYPACHVSVLLLGRISSYDPKDL
jgi:hypothetical protein